MNSSVIAILVVLIVPLLIVFLATNKKVQKLAKKKTAERNLLTKHYYSYFWYLILLPFPIIAGGELVIDVYGKTGAQYFLGLLVLLFPVIWKLDKNLIENAKQKDAEGDEGHKANYEFTKKHYPHAYRIWSAIGGGVGGLLGVYLSDLGFYYVFTFGPLFIIGIMPLDYWIHLKLFEKAKLLEEKTK